MKKGKIISLKKGYNPNSSSIGSQIPVYFIFIISTSIVSIILMFTFGKIKKIFKNKKSGKSIGEKDNKKDK